MKSEKPNIIKIFLPFLILVGIVLLIQGSVSLINNFEENRILFILFGIAFSVSLISFSLKLDWGKNEEYKRKVKDGVVIFFVSLLILYFLSVAVYHLYDIIVEKNTTTLGFAILIGLFYFIIYLSYKLNKYRKENPENNISKLISKCFKYTLFIVIISIVLILPIYAALYLNDPKAQAYMVIIGIIFVVILISILSELPKKWKKK